MFGLLKAISDGIDASCARKERQRKEALDLERRKVEALEKIAKEAESRKGD